MKIKDMSIRVKITMVSLISLTILAIVISIVAVIKVENALVNENYIKNHVKINSENTYWFSEE